MAKRAVLLLPGEVEIENVRNLLDINDYIIAVDGGIDKVIPLNLNVDLWVGDFDSCTDADLVQFSCLLQECHPREKGELDSELAFNHLLSLGIKNVLLIGGIGGRLDHQMALMMMPLQYREFSFIYSDGKVLLYTIPNDFELELTTQEQKIISIIPLENLEGVTIIGTKWELINQSLHVGFGLSLSNETTKEYVRVSCKKGRAWLYYQYNS